jgi:hypothetical protein
MRIGLNEMFLMFVSFHGGSVLGVYMLAGFGVISL